MSAPTFLSSALCCSVLSSFYRRGCLFCSPHEHRTELIWLQGVFLYMYLLGGMVNLLQNFNLNAAAFASHRDKINTFLQLREIPAEMQLRVHRYRDEIWLLKHGVDEQEVLASLPHFIRHDLAWFLNQQFLEKIPMFFGIMFLIVCSSLQNAYRFFLPSSDGFGHYLILL